MSTKSESKKELRVPPQSLESEMAVLGSLLLRAGALHEVVDIIEPTAFYAGKHAIIYQAILDLFAKGEPIDLLTVSQKLKEKGDIERIGGAGYIAELTNTVPASTNVRHYAEIVHNKAILRHLIESSDHISALGWKENADINEVLDEAERTIFAVTASPKSQRFVGIKTTLNEAMERIERLHESKDELRGVPTGFPALDSLLSGLQKSDLIILAARPSVGKTTLALDIARMAATKHNIPVGIFSLEMSAQQLVDCMLAAESHVDAWSLRTGKLSADKEFSKLRDALDKLSKAPIYIDDQASNTLVRMRSVARKLKSEHGLGLIIVDYLQLINPGRQYDSMVNQVTEISRALKQLARELDVPVLALSQLSRAIEARGGRPRLSDLRDSGSIEQDADVVAFIHREDKYKDQDEKTNIAEILIEKHRNGPTGKVELYFDQKMRTFLSVEKSSFSDFTPATPKTVSGSDDMF
jgi:replicative DNA helicase